MTFEDILQIVEQLSDTDKRKLQVYLDSVTQRTAANLTPVERARRLNLAFDELGDGLSAAQLEDMTRAMNEDYMD